MSMSVSAPRSRSLEGAAASFWLRSRNWRSSRKSQSSLQRAANARMRQLAAYKIGAPAITAIGQECRIIGVTDDGAMVKILESMKTITLLPLPVRRLFGFGKRVGVMLRKRAMSTAGSPLIPPSSTSMQASSTLREQCLCTTRRGGCTLHFGTSVRGNALNARSSERARLAFNMREFPKNRPPNMDPK